ncbi:J domain-containing protein [Myxococcota bacterium]|nr:J domain-containing protein [Myxococcota bacterium]
MIILRILAFGILIFALLRFIRSFQTSAHREPTPKNGPHPPAGRPSENNPYKILGLDSSTSMEEIKQAWQTKIRQYHPDLLQNAAPEILSLAEERTKEINEAYSTLKKRHQKS